MFALTLTSLVEVGRGALVALVHYRLRRSLRILADPRRIG